MSTTGFIAGRDIQSNLGVVVGSEHFQWRNSDDVEVKTQAAIRGLTNAARNIQADVVIGLRIESVTSEEHTGEHIVCYGTAVKLKPQ